MHRLAVVVLSLALACAAAACEEEGPTAATSGEATGDTSALTTAELDWVRAYSTWSNRFYEDEPDVGPRARRACQNTVERIGPAPTTRLEGAAARIQEICPLIERIGSVRRARDRIDEVDDFVLGLFRDAQSVELRGGITDRSRADIVFSGIASDVIGHPVEVRCWDEEDWSRLVVEDNAWFDGDDDPDEFVGLADDWDERIHLTLDVCNMVADARRRDITTLNRYDRIDAVEAIETLLHEIGHFLGPDASEAEVECKAIRGLPEFLGRFGVTGFAARELTELYRAEVYPTLDDEYTEGGCPRIG